ncbi:thiamine phosphate synthase [Rummeliibacillus pycnus]|uniref:thiamine phosphate synthase n=1 Tax=Rummeliibacillus pycnus TaxID=101070 RepID=UPI000C9AA002|nr:thiamine phosphate synthase [Rummeliibacillus pycnus]
MDKKVALHIITDGQHSLHEVVHIATKFEPDIRYLHIREPGWTAAELFDCVKKLAYAGFPLQKIVINDRIDVALATNVSHVQLGYRSIPIAIASEKFSNLKMGASIHSLEEAINTKANWYLYGHIFDTASKKGIACRGTKLLQQLVNSISIPVIAIGGVTPQNTKEVCATGVSGIAVMSGIWQANDPVAKVKEYAHQLKEWEDEKF